MEKKIIILTGPSGVGKTTISQLLTEKMPQLSFLISVTTRSHKHGEIPGRDYYFTTVEEFKRRIGNDEFIEWEEVYKGKFYGTLYSELERIRFCEKHPLRVVDIKGAQTLKEKFGSHALTIFIQPPSWRALERRLRDRNRDSPKEIIERLKTAEIEMRSATHFDKIVVNNNLNGSVARVIKLINKFISS
jgi:guanylate kinase